MGFGKTHHRLDVANAPVTHDVTIGDEPINGTVQWDPAVIAQWRKGAHKHPAETMRQALGMLYRISSRKPFDREHWVAWAELGHEVYPHVPQKIGERFLMVTGGNRRGKTDLQIAIRSRTAMIRILQNEDPQSALLAVREQLAQLPFKETYIVRDGWSRASAVPKDLEVRELYQRYRLVLETILLELLEQTGREPDPQLIEYVEQGLAHYEMTDRESRNGKPVPLLPDGYEDFIAAEDDWTPSRQSMPFYEQATANPSGNGNGDGHVEEAELARERRLPA